MLCLLADVHSAVGHALKVIRQSHACIWCADDMWLSLGELGVNQNEQHFQLGKVEDEIKALVQKK